MIELRLIPVYERGSIVALMKIPASIENKSNNNNNLRPSIVWNNKFNLNASSIPAIYLKMLKTLNFIRQFNRNSRLLNLFAL